MLGEGGRSSRGAGNGERGSDATCDARCRHANFFICGDSGNSHRLLRHDASAGVMAQRAAQLVVENRAARAVTRFHTRLRDHHVARVRERDGAAAKHLYGEE